MKPIHFFIILLGLTTSVMSQYSGKEKIFKAADSWKLEKFKTEFEGLVSSGVIMDSVYYYREIKNDEIEEKKTKVNIVDEVMMYSSIEILEYLYSQKSKFGNFQELINHSYPYLLSGTYNEERLQYVLGQGADINARCHLCGESSLLSLAIFYEHFDLAVELIDKGADVNQSPDYGETPLMGTVFTDSFSIEVFNRILDHPNLQISSTDSDGRSALSHALYFGNIYASKRLLAEGALLTEEDQANLIASGSVQLFRQFKDEEWLKKNINTWREYDEEDDLEYSLLDNALMSENPKMVKLLLVDYKANANLFEDIYDNVLYAAIDFYSEEMVNVILDYSKDENVNKYYLKRAKKRRFSKETLDKIEALIGS